jgi:hypothetical protein
VDCGDLCDAGAGGGGYAAKGGTGGSVDSSFGKAYATTPGGGVCGLATNEPLVGGAGGAGGTYPGTYTNADTGLEPNPGPGGAGGGALQISSLVSVTVTATGAITAPGGGGANTVSGGGTGGGAGGGILLEAPLVTVQGTLAANGGGGGGGDCT